MSDKKPDVKPEVKSETKPSDSAMAEALRLVAEQMIPAAVASAVAAVSAQRGQQSAPQGRPVHAPPAAKCMDCGQELRACEGKHVLAVVYPTRYPHTADYFMGVILNGVKYLSNDAGHKVLIPANAETAIQQIVSAYEQNEQDMSVGRKKEHRSGVIGPGGSAVVPATAAWR